MVTKTRAREIYRKIKKANNFIFNPIMLFMESDYINGYSKIFYIKITTGALKHYSEDELAFLIGHELAHCKFWHLGTEDKEKSHKQEYKADMYAAQYIRRAGFNVLNAINKFNKFTPESNSHPSSEDRKARILKVYGDK